MAVAVARRARRWLFLTHRWLGVGACLVVALWFVSGAVMMYVPYPSITRAERLAALPSIDWSRVRIDPQAALRAAGADAFPAELRLEMAASGPVYRLTFQDRSRAAVSAETGARVTLPDARAAAAEARAFARVPVARVERIDRDQWTVAQGFDHARPLWLAHMADGAGTRVWVSGRTGEVVQAAARAERAWNWAGAVPHWLYLTAIRRSPELWRQVVMWTSGPAVILCATGLWVGLLRLRWRDSYSGGRRSPYRGWQRWHHWAGLVGGVTAITWTASGWLSVNPFDWFDRAPPPGFDARYAGFTAPRFPPVALARLGARLPQARQVRFAWVASRPLVIAHGADARSPRTLDPRTAAPAVVMPARLVAAASAAVGAPVAGTERLTQPDVYWYSHGGDPRPLPIVRARLADARGTWVHIDPATGLAAGTLNASGRAYRWLFGLLHDFDLPLLLAHRPVRDPLMLALLALGTAMSASGVVIGWARLTRRRRDPARTAPRGGQRAAICVPSVIR